MAKEILHQQIDLVESFTNRFAFGFLATNDNVPFIWENKKMVDEDTILVQWHKADKTWELVVLQNDKATVTNITDPVATLINITTKIGNDSKRVIYMEKKDPAAKTPKLITALKKDFSALTPAHRRLAGARYAIDS